MRIDVSGPHLGPVRTTLWSWASRRGHRRPAPYRGWTWLYFIAVGGTAWAYTEALWLGILVTVLAAALAALALYGIVSAYRKTRTPPAAALEAPAGWKARHVPASAEYQQAHHRPRDRELPS